LPSQEVQKQIVTNKLFWVPPKELVEICTLAEPPTEAQMSNPMLVFPDANSMYEAHSALLTDYAIRQTNAAGECRQQITSLRSWVESQLDLEIAP